MSSIKNTGRFWLNLVFCFFLSVMSSGAWAEYLVSPSSVSTGGGTFGEILTMSASVSGSELSLTIRKSDRSSFSESGSISIHDGSYNSLERFTAKTFDAGTFSIPVSIDLDSLTSSFTPPYQVYAHITNPAGNAWVGPIKVKKKEEITALSPTTVEGGELITFTISGNYMAEPLKFGLSSALGLATRISNTKQTFDITFRRDVASSYTKFIYIYDNSGSVLLKVFAVSVNRTVRRISSITPSNLKRGELATFIIEGINLPDSAEISFLNNRCFNPDGGDIKVNFINSEKLTFQCMVTNSINVVSLVYTIEYIEYNTTLGDIELRLSGGTRSIPLEEETDPTNGECGAEDGQSYPSDATGWASSNFCSVGEPNPSSPTFPTVNNPAQWYCQGSNGGNDASCSAKRESIVSTVKLSSVKPKKIRSNRKTNILIDGVNLPEEINVSLDSKNCVKFDTAPTTPTQPVYIFSCEPQNIGSHQLLITDNNGNIITNDLGENLPIDIVSESETENTITALPLLSNKFNNRDSIDLRRNLRNSKEIFDEQFKSTGNNIKFTGIKYIDDSEFIKSTSGYASARTYMVRATASYVVEKLRIENEADVVYMFSEDELKEKVGGALKPVGGLVHPPPPDKIDKINTYSVIIISTNSIPKKHIDNVILHELGHLLGLRHGFDRQKDGNFHINGDRVFYGRGYCDLDNKRSSLMFYPDICIYKTAIWEKTYSKHIGCATGENSCTHNSYGIIEITAPEMASNYLN